MPQRISRSPEEGSWKECWATLERWWSDPVAWKMPRSYRRSRLTWKEYKGRSGKGHSHTGQPAQKRPEPCDQMHISGKWSSQRKSSLSYDIGMTPKIKWEGEEMRRGEGGRGRGETQRSMWPSLFTVAIAPIKGSLGNPDQLSSWVWVSGWRGRP